MWGWGMAPPGAPAVPGPLALLDPTGEEAAGPPGGGRAAREPPGGEKGPRAFRVCEGGVLGGGRSTAQIFFFSS